MSQKTSKEISPKIQTNPYAKPFPNNFHLKLNENRPMSLTTMIHSISRTRSRIRRISNPKLSKMSRIICVFRNNFPAKEKAARRRLVPISFLHLSPTDSAQCSQIAQTHLCQIRNLQRSSSVPL